MHSVDSKEVRANETDTGSNTTVVEVNLNHGETRHVATHMDRLSNVPFVEKTEANSIKLHKAIISAFKITRQYFLDEIDSFDNPDWSFTTVVSYQGTAMVMNVGMQKVICLGPDNKDNQFKATAINFAENKLPMHAISVKGAADKYIAIVSPELSYVNQLTCAADEIEDTSDIANLIIEHEQEQVRTDDYGFIVHKFASKKIKFDYIDEEDASHIGKAEPFVIFSLSSGNAHVKNAIAEAPFVFQQAFSAELDLAFKTSLSNDNLPQVRSSSDSMLPEEPVKLAARRAASEPGHVQSQSDEFAKKIAEALNSPPAQNRRESLPATLPNNKNSSDRAKLICKIHKKFDVITNDNKYPVFARKILDDLRNKVVQDAKHISTMDLQSVEAFYSDLLGLTESMLEIFVGQAPNAEPLSLNLADAKLKTFNEKLESFAKKYEVDLKALEQQSTTDVESSLENVDDTDEVSSFLNSAKPTNELANTPAQSQSAKQTSELKRYGAGTILGVIVGLGLLTFVGGSIIVASGGGAILPAIFLGTVFGGAGAAVSSGAAVISTNEENKPQAPESAAVKQKTSNATLSEKQIITKAANSSFWGQSYLATFEKVASKALANLHETFTEFSRPANSA